MPLRRLLTLIAIGLPVLLLAGIAAVATDSYREHRRLVEVERAAYPAPGALVRVGTGAAESGGLLHVYAEGEGDPTLVFLAGLGTSAPYFDFMTLHERLSDDYRVAVVERAGYGWSDITDSPRDIASVLHETRTALRRAGEGPPYVLFPHSMAGLEAALWAMEHPEEVEAVIGLDPLVPRYLERTDERPSLSWLETVLARTGLMRSGADVFETSFPAMTRGLLSDREAEVAEAIFHRRTHTPDMWDEVRALPGNAAKVAALDPPDRPFHAFVSDEATEVWTESVKAYAEATGGETFVLYAGHHVHLDRPELIAQTSRALIEDAR